MVGGSGTDTLSYISEVGSVTINLAASTAASGSGSDYFGGFLNVLGSSFSDTIIGDTNYNIIDGWTGDDRIIGGGGTDTISFGLATGVVTVNLSASSDSGAEGSDTIIGFLNVIGSSGGSSIVGDLNANSIQGVNASDTIEGGLGNDTMTSIGGLHGTISFGSAAGAVTVSLVNSSSSGEQGSDIFSGFINVIGGSAGNSITGDSKANSITGGAGNDLIEGGIGNDIMIGFGGTDLLSYGTATASVTVNLTSSTSNGAGGKDTFYGFLNVLGSSVADSIVGNTNNNLIDGQICSHTPAMFASKKLTAYKILQCLYVDDGAFSFGTREDLINGMNLIYHHFRQFGLEMHIGQGTSESKTECIFFPPPNSSTTPITKMQLPRL
jgi:Ca2+-binding RTX toxin-like protein